MDVTKQYRDKSKEDVKAITLWRGRVLDQNQDSRAEVKDEKNAGEKKEE